MNRKENFKEKILKKIWPQYSNIMSYYLLQNTSFQK